MNIVLADVRQDDCTSHHASRYNVRGGVDKTFASIGGILALMLLGAGIFLLQETLTDPLHEQSIGLIFGAFVSVLGAMLVMYFICSPLGKFLRDRVRRRSLPRPPVRFLNMAAPRAMSYEEILLIVPNVVMRKDVEKELAIDV